MNDPGIPAANPSQEKLRFPDETQSGGSQGAAIFELDLPPAPFEALAHRLLQSGPPPIEPSASIDIPGQRWAAWPINGCVVARSEGGTEGYCVPESREPRGAPASNSMPEAVPILEQLSLPGRWHAIRLFALGPDCDIEPHRDEGERYALVEWWQVVKVHMPIVVNEDCRNFYLDAEGRRHDVALQPGGYYLQDGRRPHGARNGGKSVRWHLVVDLEMDEATVDRLRSPAIGS